MVGRTVLLRVDPGAGPTGRRRPARGRPAGAAMRVAARRRRRRRSRCAPARSWASPGCRATVRPSWSRRWRGCARWRGGRARLARDVHAPGPRREPSGGRTAHIPEDRQKHGLVLRSRSPTTSFSAPTTRRRSRAGARSTRRRSRACARADGGVRHARAGRCGRRGGAALGRQPAEGDHGARVIAAGAAGGRDQPTRGVDVGSVEFIHRPPVARATRAAVLLVSAELDELLAWRTASRCCTAVASWLRCARQKPPPSGWGYL